MLRSINRPCLLLSLYARQINDLSHCSYSLMPDDIPMIRWHIHLWNTKTIAMDIWYFYSLKNVNWIRNLSRDIGTFRYYVLKLKTSIHISAWWQDYIWMMTFRVYEHMVPLDFGYTRSINTTEFKHCLLYYTKIYIYGFNDSFSYWCCSSTRMMMMLLINHVKRLIHNGSFIAFHVCVCVRCVCMHKGLTRQKWIISDSACTVLRWFSFLREWICHLEHGIAALFFKRMN